MILIILSSPDQKEPGELSVWASFVVGLGCPSTISNIASPEITRIVIKFHTESPGIGGTKIFSNSPGHMSNMAVMLYYDKTFIFFYSCTNQWMNLKLGR